jgi:hypothetical protein
MLVSLQRRSPLSLSLPPSFLFSPPLLLGPFSSRSFLPIHRAITSSEECRTTWEHSFIRKTCFSLHGDCNPTTSLVSSSLSHVSHLIPAISILSHLYSKCWRRHPKCGRGTRNHRRHLDHSFNKSERWESSTNQ